MISNGDSPFSEFPLDPGAEQRQQFPQEFFSLPQKGRTKGCSADRLPVPDQLQLQVSTHTHPLVNKALTQETFSLH